MARKVAAKIAADQAAEEAAAKRQAALDEAAAERAAAAQAEELRRVEGEVTARLKEPLLGALHDPASAEFRNLALRENGTVLCGDVNAKNSFGGYVGFRPFVVHPGGVAVWSGSCSGKGDIDAQLACLRPQRAYIAPAIKAGCKTQDEINLLVGLTG